MGLVSRRMREEYLALQSAGQSAIDHFEKVDGFPEVQVQVLDGIERLQKESPNASAPWLTPARLDFVLELFNLRAEAYLGLVHDIESQKHYRNLLVSFGVRATEEYTGMSAANVLFAGNTQSERTINDRLRHWTRESYQRLVKPASPTESKPKTSRRKFIEPLLAAKGWSVLDWANEAAVSHATAMDYLDEKTTPYAETRRKLAKVLEIPVESLP